jgi:hypothetical protein
MFLSAHASRYNELSQQGHGLVGVNDACGVRRNWIAFRARP